MEFRLFQLAKSELVLFSDNFSVSKAYTSHLKSLYAFVLFLQAQKGQNRTSSLFTSSKFCNFVICIFYKIRIIFQTFPTLNGCKQIQILRSARANSQGQKKPLSNTLQRKKGFGTHVFLFDISIVEISVTVENSDEVERTNPTENSGSQRFHMALLRIKKFI